MKTQKLDLGDAIFEVQIGMSFIQQNELMELIEDFIDFGKMDSIKDNIEDETMTFEDLASILKEGAKITTFTAKLTIFCLLNFVKEPKITMAMLEDPEDPNVLNFAVVGQELVKETIQYIAKRALLKKTPMK